MAIPVGIHENVKFSAEINDKGSLVITASKGEVKELDLDSTDDSNEGEEQQTFLFYPFKTEGYEKNQLVPKRSAPLVAQDMKDLKAVLNHILKHYLDEDQIEWSLYEGTPVTTENQGKTLFDNDENLGLVYTNMANQFIQNLAKAEDKDKLFRVVFVRTSGPKHYPKLRNRELDKFPFMESMDVPLEESKVVFTPYELGAKLDNPAPVAPNQSATDKKIPELDV